MHQARVRARPLADHPRSYPAHHPTVRVDDTDTWLLAAAARELEAHLSFERARQVADARACWPRCTRVTAWPSRTPCWTPRPRTWPAWSGPTGSSTSWLLTSSRTRRCWRRRPVWTTTPC